MFIVYLTAGIDHHSGKSWCPDCDKAQPIIQSALIDKSKLPIIKGIVMDGDSWVGKTDHPYKTHSILKACGVPSIMLCQGEEVLRRADTRKHFQYEKYVASFNGEEFS